MPRVTGKCFFRPWTRSSTPLSRILPVSWEVTGRDVVLADLGKLRVGLVADLLRLRAARREAAALREVARIGRLTLDALQALDAFQARHAAEQRDGVGVGRIPKDGVGGTVLDDAAGVHHGHAVAH